METCEGSCGTGSPLQTLMDVRWIGPKRKAVSIVKVHDEYKEEGDTCLSEAMLGRTGVFQKVIRINWKVV